MKNSLIYYTLLFEQSKYQLAINLKFIGSKLLIKRNSTSSIEGDLSSFIVDWSESLVCISSFIGDISSLALDLFNQYFEYKVRITIFLIPFFETMIILTICKKISKSFFTLLKILVLTKFTVERIIKKALKIKAFEKVEHIIIFSVNKIHDRYLLNWKSSLRDTRLEIT